MIESGHTEPKSKDDNNKPLEGEARVAPMRSAPKKKLISDENLCALYGSCDTTSFLKTSTIDTILAMIIHKVNEF